MLNKIIEFFVGKRVEVSLYNKNIMEPQQLKTTKSKLVCNDFFEWSKQLTISSSCPKQVGLDYEV